MSWLPGLLICGCAKQKSMQPPHAYSDILKLLGGATNPPFDWTPPDAG